MVLELRRRSCRIGDCSRGVGGMGKLMVMRTQKGTSGLDVFERDELMAW